MKAFVIVLIFAVATVVLQILGRAEPAPGNWGVNQYGFLSGTWFAVGWAGMALLLALGALRGAGLGRVRLPWRVVALLVGVAGAGLYWLARDRAFFLGDGYFWTEGFAAGNPAWYLEPGAVLSLSFLNRLLGGHPEFTLALASTACGFVYLLASVLFAREVAESNWGRAVVFGILALGGITRIFAGTVETHALVAVAAMLYLVFTVRYLRGRGSLAGPVIMATIAPLLYPAALLLLPSLVYVLIKGPGGPAAEETPARGGAGPRLAVLAIPLAVFAAAAYVIWRHPYPLGGTLDYSLGKLLPLGAPTQPTEAYSMFSAAHLRDFFQEQMLHGPFGTLFVIVLLAFGAGGRLGREGRFLLWAGVPWWVHSFMFNHEMGAARGWGVFVPATLPFLLLAGLLLSRVSWAPRRPRLAGVMAGLVLAASFFHLLPWMGVTMDGDRAVGQLATLYGPGSQASPFARSYAYEEIAAWYMEHEMPDAAVTALREAAEADSTNIRAAGNLAALLVRSGQNDEAAQVMEKSARRAPEGELIYFRLGNAYRDLGQFDDAANAYAAALNVAPGFRDGYLALAEVELARGRPAAARDILVRAWERFPEDTEILGRLGGVYEILGDNDPAEQIYRDLLVKIPDDPGSLFNLGRLLIRKKEYEESAELLSSFLEQQPGDAEAWTNLGVAQSGLGRKEEARESLNRAMSLAPERPEPYFNLARMNIMEGDTTRAVDLMRTYAAMDSTSEWARLARSFLLAVGEETP